MAMAGIDPMRFMTTTDDVERLVMQAIARRVGLARQRIDQNRAVLIANAVGRLFGGK